MFGRMKSMHGSAMHVWIPLLVALFSGFQSCLAQNDADPAGSDDARVVAFVDVAVVSMQDEAVLKGQTVVVVGERIESIGSVDTVSVPAGALVIDGTGFYLVPGLADMHVHVGVPFVDGSLYLNAGVTTVLSMGTSGPDLESIIQERDRSHTRDFDGPDLYTVGPRFMGGETPADAERIVRLNAQMGFDLVKVYHEVSPATYARLHEVADELGIKVTGHGQRDLGMQPIYTHGQDLAHVEEYLYGAFNPNTTGFKIVSNVCLIVMALAFLMSVTWGFGAIRRRVRMRRSSDESASTEECPAFRAVKIWVRHFTGASCLFFLGFVLIAPEPYMGVLAGKMVIITLASILMLLVVFIAFKLTLVVRDAWREDAASIARRIALLLVFGFAWVFVIGACFLTPRIWRTSEWGLERMARRSKEADIWVTTTLVVFDSNVKHQTDEFEAIIARPEMRYLTPEIRDRWINNNRFRIPPAARPMQHGIWQSWTKLMSRLIARLHEAGVPLLAGSDAGGPPRGVPGRVHAR